MASARLGWVRSAFLVIAIAAVVGLVLVGLPFALVVGGGQLAPVIAVGNRATSVTALALAVICGIAALAAIGAAAAMIAGRSEGRRGQSVARLDLLLRLEERFRYSEFADVSANLQDGGRWVVQVVEGIESGPENDEDWLRVTAYVRLFEPVYFLARDGGVPSDVLRSTYGYRIEQLVRNKKIVSRMISNRSVTPWIHLLRLWQIVDPSGYAHWVQFMKLWQVVDSGGYDRLLHPANPAAPLPTWQR